MMKNIPQELLQQKRWLPCGANKLPFFKGWTKPENQMTFDAAAAQSKRVGFETSGHGIATDYALFDFDHVLDDNGEFVNAAAADCFQSIMQQLNCYAERSISGHGIHIIAAPTADRFTPIGAGKNGTLYFGDDSKLEVFYKTKGRHCLMTGNLFATDSLDIAHGAGVDEVFQHILAEIQMKLREADNSARQGSLNLNAAGYDDVEAKTPTDSDRDNELAELAELEAAEIAECREENFDNGDAPIAEKSARQTGFYSDNDRDYDLLRAPLMLDGIDPADLADSDWLAVNSACKNIGVPYSVVDAFNRRDPARYDAVENQRRWDSCNDPNFDIETLHGITKRFNIYREKDAWHKFYGNGKTPAQNSATVTETAANDSASDIEPAATDNTSASQAEEFSSGDPALDDKLQKYLTDWQRSNRSLINPEFLHEITAAAVAVNVETINPADVATEHFRRQLAVLGHFARPMYLDALKKIYSQDEKPPLTRKKLEEDIERRITPIRRDQNKFTQDAERKRREQEEAAARERLRAKMLTTQKAIADCPADLLIPDDVFFDKSGVGLQYVQGDRCYQQRAALSPIVPVKVLRDPRTNSASYEVAVLSRGKWHSVQMTATELADARKILRLADCGGKIEEPAKLCKFFGRMLARNENSIPEINSYSQPGWHGAKFIYPPAGKDYIVRRNDFDYPVMFAKRGDVDMWKKIFLEAVDAGGAVARAFVGNALAAPLVRLLNLRNLQLHVHGKGGTGKSTLNALASSIFGNPRRLIRTFAATRKNMLSAAAAFDDLPSFYDELETVKRYKAGESIADMVYEFSEGIGNQANRRDGTARQPLYFAGSRNSTAERPILQSNDLRGALRRLWQIRTEKIFTPEFSAEISAVIAKNYGLFGGEWFKFVSSHPKEIIAKYNQLADICKTTAAQKNFEPQLFQTAMTAAFAFQMFLVVVGVNHIGEVVNKAGVELDDNLFTLIPTARDIDDSRRALDDLRSYTAAHIQLFIRAGQSSDGEHYTTRGEYLGKICNDGDIAFFTTALKKILEGELGFASTDALIAEWYQQGLLKTSTGKGYRYYSKVGAIPKYMYRFKADGFKVDDPAEE